MITKKQVTPIFPTPVYYSNLNRKFTKKETDFFKKIISSKVDNFGNTVSSNNYVLTNKIMKKIKEEIDIRVKEYLDKIICPKKKYKSLYYSILDKLYVKKSIPSLSCSP